MSDLVRRLEDMLARDGETALLHFSLGNAKLKDDPADAAAHLRRAVELDPDYSAAWKLLGRALAGNGEAEAARKAWTRGIEVAGERGDVQAAKEMRVFLKRLDKLK